MAPRNCLVSDLETKPHCQLRAMLKFVFAVSLLVVITCYKPDENKSLDDHWNDYKDIHGNVESKLTN